MLLPHPYKMVGWVLFIPAILAGLAFTWKLDLPLITIPFPAIAHTDFFQDDQHWTITKANLFGVLIPTVGILGGLLITFSKEKQEDEFIDQLRLNALQWAVLVNYLALLLASLLIHGMAFLDVVIYNMFTVLLIFILRFHFMLYKTRRASHEKQYQGTESYS